MSRALDFGHLVDLCRRTHEEARRSAARAADTYLVTRNWLFGWYIVEYEDGGADRSTLYGKNLIARLSDELKAGGLKGCSPTNLRKFREFYRAYPEIQQTLSVESRMEDSRWIQQTASVESPPTAADIAPDVRPSLIGPTPSDQFVPLLATLSRPLEEVIGLFAGRFTLGWSHYVTHLTIDRAEDHAFYEVEEAQNQTNDSRRLRYQRHRWRGTLQR